MQTNIGLVLSLPLHNIPLLSQIIHTDVLIIGAGPAGATASLFLAKKSIAHSIVDAAVFPRDKICGDGLDLKVVRVLRHLDPQIVEEELPGDPGFLPCYGARFISSNGRKSDFTYAPKPLFWTSKRQYFDDFLVKKLDPNFADFRPGTKVEQIFREGKEWRIHARSEAGELEFHTNLLLAADGEHSVMLRHLGERGIERRHHAATLRQYWKGVEGLDARNLIEVYFPKALPMSYFYIFPLPGGEANVGYGMVSEVLAKNKINLRETFKKLLREDPYMSPRFADAQALEEPKGWGLPLASRRRRAFGEGYLLLGDAASLVCPTSGEGIGTGMISGYIAAHFAEEALKRKDFSVVQFRHYDREIYRRLHSEIRLYNLMMGISPKVYEFGLNLLAPNPLFRWSFRHRVGGWMRTAYEKGIEVRV